MLVVSSSHDSFRFYSWIGSLSSGSVRSSCYEILKASKFGCASFYPLSSRLANTLSHLDLCGIKDTSLCHLELGIAVRCHGAGISPPLPQGGSPKSTNDLGFLRMPERQATVSCRSSTTHFIVYHPHHRNHEIQPAWVLVDIAHWDHSFPSILRPTYTSVQYLENCLFVRLI